MKESYSVNSPEGGAAKRTLLIPIIPLLEAAEKEIAKRDQIINLEEQIIDLRDPQPANK